jgi:hypothetical protein
MTPEQQRQQQYEAAQAASTPSVEAASAAVNTAVTSPEVQAQAATPVQTSEPPRRENQVNPDARRRVAEQQALVAALVYRDADLAYSTVSYATMANQQLIEKRKMMARRRGGKH